MGRKTAEMASKIVTQSDAFENKVQDEKLTIMEEKLDKLVQTVGLLQENMQKQNDWIQVRDISPVPSAHSSMKESPGSAQYLPSFEELRSDGKIQAELQKRLHHYDKIKIEHIRSRNTQRLVPDIVNGRAGRSSDSSEKVIPCKLYNKGTCRYEKQTEHTDKGTTYGHYCSHCIVVTGKKYEHPRNQCLRLKNEKKEGGTSQRV